MKSLHLFSNTKALFVAITLSTGPIMALPGALFIDAIPLKTKDGGKCFIGRKVVSATQFADLVGRLPKAVPAPGGEETITEEESRALLKKLESEFMEQIENPRLRSLPPKPSRSGDLVSWKLIANEIRAINSKMKHEHAKEIMLAKERAKEEFERQTKGKKAARIQTTDQVPFKEARIYLEALEKTLGNEWEVRLPAAVELRAHRNTLPDNRALPSEWLKDGTLTASATAGFFRPVLIRRPE